MSAEDRKLIMDWQNTEEARRLRRRAAILRRERLAREAAERDIAEVETEPEGGDEPEGTSTSGAADGGYVVASDASSGRSSPAPLVEPVVIVQQRAHRQAHAWATMGTDLMVRLELVALEMREQREGRPSTAPVDACELHIAWDRMVRAVSCDDHQGCLFDTSRLSSDDD